MKKYISRKLNSRKGSSLLLALLFSIICLLLGVAILTAGVTSNGRIVNAARTEQGYFIVSSVFNAIDSLTRMPDRAHPGTFYNLGFQLDINLANSEKEEDRKIAISELDEMDGMPRLNLGPLHDYFTSALKDAVESGNNQIRRVEFTFGEELGEGYVYTAVVDMIVKANDYSVYFDICDIRKGTEDASESVGLPNLHTIAVETRSVTPVVVERLEDGTDLWKIVNFEFHRAKYVK